MNIINLLDNIERRLSTYPFYKASTLEFDGGLFPVFMIKSLSLQVYDCIFPLYISRIYISNKTLYLVINDSSLLKYKVILLPDILNSKILDNYDTLAGSLYHSALLYEFLYSIILNKYNKSMELTSSQLILDSSCISCFRCTGIRAVNINNTFLTGKVSFDFRRNISITNKELNVFGDLLTSYININKLKFINGIDLTKKNLIVKHNILSDIRVTTAGDTIILTGIKDA